MAKIVTFEVNPCDSGGESGDEAAARCKCCRGDIWPGETYGTDGSGRAICIDCARDGFGSLTAREQLVLMGFEPVDAPAQRRRISIMR